MFLLLHTPYDKIGLLVGISNFFFWYNRKMGYSYEKTGTTSSGVVYHFGSILLTIGWFIIWISINAIHAIPNSNYIYFPIYYSNRLFISIIGIFCIIVVTWLSSYALDESNNDDVTTKLDQYMNGVGFGISKYYFSYVYEVKYVMIFSWFILSICPFTYLYMMNNIWEPIILSTSILLVGIIISIQYEYGLRACNMQLYSRLNHLLIYSYMLVIGLLYWISGLMAAVLSLIGVILIRFGMSILHHDRKRGHDWLMNESSINSNEQNLVDENIDINNATKLMSTTTTTTDINSINKATSTINPNYTSYSIGPVLYIAGMLLFAWGLSIP